MVGPANRANSYDSAPFSAGEGVTVKVDPDDPNAGMIWGKA